MSVATAPYNRDLSLVEDVVGRVETILDPASGGSFAASESPLSAVIRAVAKHYDKKPEAGQQRGIGESTEDAIDRMARSAQLISREIPVEPGWQRRYALPFIAERRSDGTPFALIPSGSTWLYVDGSRPRKPLRLDAETAASLGSEGWALSPALPDKALTLKELLLFGLGTKLPDLAAFAAHVRTDHLPHAVILDCSASDAVAAHYADWLAAGIHVITPNKNAGAGDWNRYQAIRAAAAHSGARFRYEATVGAGLPIIQTLRDLLDTGDELQAVDGIFSGTLAWLFNRYDGKQPFSELVLEAKALGYTEPDPRDDLSGADVARKLVILAREAGVALSLEDVEVESLVPGSLTEASREEFLQRLGETDATMQARHAAAAARGQVLRYVASLQPARDGAHARARVGLVELPVDHAFAHLRLTDNVVQFSTRRYSENPLVVQGPGAGPEVTAAGVFADLLRVLPPLQGPQDAPDPRDPHGPARPELADKKTDLLRDGDRRARMDGNRPDPGRGGERQPGRPVTSPGTPVAPLLSTPPAPSAPAGATGQQPVRRRPPPARPGTAQPGTSTGARSGPRPQPIAPSDADEPMSTPMPRPGRHRHESE